MAENNILKEADEEVTNIFDSLVVNAYKNKIPEKIFVNYFLPYFTNKEAYKEDNILAEWIAVAGTPTSEVEVIDYNNEVLFTVPSVFDTSIINLNNLNNENARLKSIMINYQLENNNLPIVANNNLKENLEYKLGQMTTESTNTSNKRKSWNNILERYGYIKPSEDKTKSSTDTDDDLVYD